MAVDRKHARLSAAPIPGTEAGEAVWPVRAGQPVNRNAIMKGIPMALPYHPALPASTAIIPTLSGQYLARNGESRVVRAFFAADMHLGAKRLDKPTISKRVLSRSCPPRRRA